MTARKHPLPPVTPERIDWHSLPAVKALAKEHARHNGVTTRVVRRDGWDGYTITTQQTDGEVVAMFGDQP